MRGLLAVGEQVCYLVCIPHNILLRVEGEERAATLHLGGFCQVLRKVDVAPGELEGFRDRRGDDFCPI